MEKTICIIGLGYVGLPIAVEFGKKYPTVGFDINKKRVDELSEGIDITLEVDSTELKKAHYLSYTASIDDCKNCNYYIVCVPTPIDEHKKPDLTPLIKSSEQVGKVLKKGDIVVYESTVYPGCTEEECVPILENVSGLLYNKDFFCGYSPERINPGDREHTFARIKKVVSGSTPEVAEKINNLYSSVVTAGTYLAPSIKVAEAAKVIENAQRDINIAFVNELSLIFHRMSIDTKEVLKAASTKWNFLNFTPGLVGGHCIGVDPYYLTFKAQSVGYLPEVILAGRRINDSMGIYIAREVVKLMIKKNHMIQGSDVLVLGITFKENCPDIRNSKVIDIIQELNDFGCQTYISDPWAELEEVETEYGIKMLDDNSLNRLKFNAIIIAVAHDEFKDYDLNNLKKDNCVVYDVKWVLDKSDVDGRL